MSEMPPLPPSSVATSAQRPGPGAPETLGVALLGCGTVGGGVVRLLEVHADAYRSRLGCGFSLVGVAVRDRHRDRGLAPDLLTDRPHELVADPRVSVVVEVMGGVDPAFDLIMAAIGHGKHVITANKEVIAKHGAEIDAAAADRGVGVYTEGAVAGGIPILAPLKRCLAANRILALSGIINGTTNFILTRMSEEGSALASALAEAQRLGFAEADPTADVEGHDAAYKIAILAGLMGHGRVAVQDVHREGISGITPKDVAHARELGYVIKLLGVARAGDDGLQVGVYPAMVPLSHPLSAIRGVTNAISVQGDAVGEVTFAGPGAGAMPTASAVVGDLLDLAEGLVSGRGPGRLMAGPAGQARVASPDRAESCFYLRLSTEDRPGVLGRVGMAMGDRGVSIASFVQRPEGDGRAEMVFVTHRVREGAFHEALEEIARHPGVLGTETVLRVLD